MSSEPIQFMSQMTSVEYRVPAASALAKHVAEALAAGRVIGHKCPECGRVYVPPRGYCPLCTVPTSEADEIEVPARGVVTTYSVITPLQYQGQEEKEDYVLATILLDNSHSTIGMQRLDGIPIADVRTGLRVEAVWLPEEERKATPGAGARGLGLGEAIEGWKPTGEPDAALNEYADYIV
jgi:uncharacterized OB-fold protein